MFEALTSNRPYRSPMAREEALRVLAEGGFDPSVYDAFLAALEDGEIDLEIGEHALATQEFVEAVLHADRIGMGLTDRRAPWRARA